MSDYAAQDTDSGSPPAWGGELEEILDGHVVILHAVVLVVWEVVLIALPIFSPVYLEEARGSEMQFCLSFRDLCVYLARGHPGPSCDCQRSL